MQELVDEGGGVEGFSKAGEFSQLDDMAKVLDRLRKLESVFAAQSKTVKGVLQMINAESAMDDVIDSIDLDKMMLKVESGEVRCSDSPYRYAIKADRMRCYAAVPSGL